MLIDCGSFRNGGASIARLKDVVGAISKDLNGSRSTSWSARTSTTIT